MLNVLKSVFSERVDGVWNDKLKQIIPSFGQHLNGNVEATLNELNYTSKVLGLHKPQQAQGDAPAPDADAAIPEKAPMADIEL
ncbi:malate:quinone oxidoreductase [Vibrio ostreae]|uniref:malate dehydrogenase (quinone) n=2 Tax=Gammaproteobacteria TaxID=1236 RepID=A0A975UAE5_9VIBR|nr:malate:quinone oxidoreductase [Vibrio ostreae]